MVEHRLLLLTLLESRGVMGAWIYVSSTATREDGSAVDRPKLHQRPLTPTFAFPGAALYRLHAALR